MFCAAGDGRDSCSGDSGGPIIMKGRGVMQDVQVGIVSWGHHLCGIKDYPGVYHRLSNSSDWVLDTASRLSSFKAPQLIGNSMDEAHTSQERAGPDHKSSATAETSLAKDRSWWLYDDTSSSIPPVN